MKIKKTSLALACSVAFLASSSFAAGHIPANFSAGYDLKPHELNYLEGGTVSHKNFTCQIRAENPEAYAVDLVALKKRSVVNGQILEEGNSTTLNVRPGETLNVEIDAWGKLGLTNNGETLVNIKCQ